MDKKIKKALKQMFNNHDRVSTRYAGKKFGCSHTHIREILLQIGVKKQRVPAYDEVQIEEVKRCCR